MTPHNGLYHSRDEHLYRLVFCELMTGHLFVVGLVEESVAMVSVAGVLLAILSRGPKLLRRRVRILRLPIASLCLGRGRAHQGNTEEQ